MELNKEEQKTMEEIFNMSDTIFKELNEKIIDLCRERNKNDSQPRSIEYMAIMSLIATRVGSAAILMGSLCFGEGDDYKKRIHAEMIFEDTLETAERMSAKADRLREMFANRVRQ